jgi:hypothetical protein
MKVRVIKTYNIAHRQLQQQANISGLVAIMSQSRRDYRYDYTGE